MKTIRSDDDAAERRAPIARNISEWWICYLIQGSKMCDIRSVQP